MRLRKLPPLAQDDAALVLRYAATLEKVAATTADPAMAAATRSLIERATPQVQWNPVPKQRFRNQIPPARFADVVMGRNIVGRIREMYGSRFGRTYDGFDQGGKMVARDTGLTAALAAIVATVKT